MMDRNAKWARTKLPEAVDLSDTELQTISQAAGRSHKFAQACIFSVALFIYLYWLEDIVAGFLFDNPSSSHRLVLAMFFGGIIGGLLGWILQTLVRRRIQAVVGSG